MRIRLPMLAPLLGAIALLLAACSSSGSSHTTTRTTTATTAATTTQLRCGVPPARSRMLSAARGQSLQLSGSPDGVASSPDGRATFVSLAGSSPRVAVITGGARPALRRTITLPAAAKGMAVTPNGRYVLAVSGRRLFVLSATAAASGSGRALLGTLTVPASAAGTGAGASEVTASADSRYAFMTLEGGGIVAVFDLSAAVPRGFSASAYVGAIPVGAGALGIAVSPDGRWLYETSESARAQEGAGQGALNVIGVARAEHDPAGSIVAAIPVACAPVRVAVSPNGATVWVSARDANSVVAFSAGALRGNPGAAVTSVTRVGFEPLALLPVSGGQRVLVVDSNYTNSRHARTGISVLNTAGATPALLGTVPAGKFPHELAAIAGVALVTNSGSDQLEAITLQQLP